MVKSFKRRETLKLSVSSIRIECLQRPLGVRIRWNSLAAFSILHSDRVSATDSWRSGRLRQPDFQYPPFGSSVCNPATRLLARVPRNTFSILHSDRVSATGEEHEESPPSSHNFQYPPFGSSVCNGNASAGTVPCGQAFQYPPFGSSVCNIKDLRAPLDDMTLSVSSIRIECLQLNIPAATRSEKYSFQYPPFGSSVCNAKVRGLCHRASRFQYPPFGSSVCNNNRTR